MFSSAAAPRFYTLHTTLLNFVEEQRRRMILAGKPSITYLSTTLKDQYTENRNQSAAHTQSTHLSKG